ncbi:DUF222 domain-containing protein, partial [Arthrobacter ipis]|uniref:DUF222 domain-containing protein n=1 Tax=Arthrobacter ipis TaxID=2716202 RepID=UPI00188A4E1C
MEAIGENRADISAGTDVSGFNAAALMRGPVLRSAPAAGSRSDSPVTGVLKDASDGGAAADSGFPTPGPGTNGSEPVAAATTELTSPPLATSNLKAALALLDSATSSAPEELAAGSFLEAADFAELTEELSRRVEYLQLQAADAVDRTRTEAINAAEAASRAAGWTTGWGTEPEPVSAPDAHPSGAAAATAGASGFFVAGAAATSDSTTTAADDAPAANPVPAASAPTPASAVAWSPADDGAHNTAEFLRNRLRISTPEARRRLALANATLPRTGLGGRPMPPEREETAAALTAGTISSRAGTIITTALDKVRHIPDPGLIAEMEHNLTLTAIENDHDFLTRIAHRWIDALDQDDTEPSEENLRHRQGVFLHHKRGGLHHLEIRATTDQYEVLTTVMNTATNPRTTTPDTTNCGSDSSDGDSGSDGDGMAGTGAEGSGPDSGGGCGDGRADSASAAVDLDAAFNAAPEPDLDRRTLAQQRLDGLVGASKAALAAGTPPPEDSAPKSWSPSATGTSSTASRPQPPKAPATTETTPAPAQQTAPGQPTRRRRMPANPDRKTPARTPGRPANPTRRRATGPSPRSPASTCPALT